MANRLLKAILVNFEFSAEGGTENFNFTLKQRMLGGCELYCETNYYRAQMSPSSPKE